MTAKEIYEHQVKNLPAGERLRLATLILNEISPRCVTDCSAEWSEEDLKEFGLTRLHESQE